jgi:hypothetical protein
MRFWKMKDFDKKNWICIEGFSFFFFRISKTNNLRSLKPESSNKTEKPRNKEEKMKKPQRHGITDAIY